MAATDIFFFFLRILCFACDSEDKQYVAREGCGYLNRLIYGRLGVSL